ncbi:MAG: DUF3180 domain-containing protein, partial [Mycobacteriales bacterium]
VLTGAWGGTFAYTFLERGRLVAANRDAFASALGVLTSLLLVSAALWLEMSCRTPDPPDDEQVLPSL